MKHAGPKSVPTLSSQTPVGAGLIVLGLEVVGRWGAEAADFLRLLAGAQCRRIPARCVCCRLCHTRWFGLLSIAAACSFAASLLSLPISNTANLDGTAALSKWQQACFAQPRLTGPHHRRYQPWVAAPRSGAGCSQSTQADELSYVEPDPFTDSGPPAVPVSEGRAQRL